MSSAIALSRIHFPVTTLGPGDRVGIWVQGCSIHCPGCISADTWAKADTVVEMNDLFTSLQPFLAAADGVTITGGEPFDQPEALGDLLRGLRERLSECKDVLVYSGYPFDRLTKYLSEWPGLIDALISEPFLAEQPQTRALMGSDNQQLHLLTELARQRFTAFDRCRDVGDDRLDFMADADGTIWLAGIPKRGDLAKLQAVLGPDVIRLDTTLHRRLS